MRWLWLLIPFFCFACGEKKPAPPKKTAKEVTYKISKDKIVVGGLNIKPGEFGTFMPADTDEGREFAIFWEEQRKVGTVAGPTAHLPTKDGSRGPLATRLYRPIDPDFAEGVREFLREKKYTVKVISNGNIAAATKPAKPPKPEEDTSYEVYKGGVKLATIYIKPGEFGTLTPEAGPEAEALRVLWEKSREEKMVKVRFQLPAKEGMAGASGSRVYRPEKRGFGKGVKFFLLDNGYEVKELPTSQPASQSTSSPSQD